MTKATPLKTLSEVISGNCNTAIFPNQTTFYQVIFLFGSNHLNANYGYANTDELIPVIKNYLHNLYYDEDVNNFTLLHKCICQNILNQSVDFDFNTNYGTNRIYLSEINFLDIRSNINKIINNKRKISKFWILEFIKNFENIDLMIYRIFWILQYFCVYYAPSSDFITKNPIINIKGDYIDYFTFLYPFKSELLCSLQNKCGQYTSAANIIDTNMFNFHILSRILYDVSKAHYECSSHVPLSYLTSSTLNHLVTTPINDYSTQLNEFIYYIDAFGQKTLDRFHILKDFAKKNFFASNELATLYFFGGDMIFGTNNHYIIQPNYKEAIKYYSYAICNSQPPYPVSCWSLGYMLMQGYCSDKSNPELNFKKAIYYFKLAGNYPPAYNSMSQLILKDAEHNFSLFKTSSCPLKYTEILDSFTKALELAKKAADNKWFYGNNVIAQFIIKHKSDTLFLRDIKERISFSDIFEIETQLNISASYNNPWALHALATYYMDMNDLQNSERLLLKACKLEHNRSFYTLAMHFYTGNIKLNYLIQSSNRNYPFASYELAKIYYENGDNELFLSYLSLAEQQNIAMPYINQELQLKINHFKTI